jgi:hypothetical protein
MGVDAVSLIGTLTDVGLRRHRIDVNENLATISEAYYGCTDYAAAIWQANDQVLASPNSAPVGTTIVIPYVSMNCRHHG